MIGYQMNYGNKGKDVWLLQEFLIDQNVTLYYGVDGDFGPDTAQGLRKYQARKSLYENAIFAGTTIQRALADGFPFDPRVSATDHQRSLSYPTRPDYLRSPTLSYMEATFGRFDFTKQSNQLSIQIDEQWASDNLVTIEIPQLKGSILPIGNRLQKHNTGKITCHRLAADKFRELFQAWDDAGLIDRILIYSGVQNARMQVGKAHSRRREHLSNHCWGTAIDINSITNAIGVNPPIVGVRGSVREMVGIANNVGFYWGGHYSRRFDGMHFELGEPK